MKNLRKGDAIILKKRVFAGKRAACLLACAAIDSGYVYFRDKQNIKNTYTDEEIIAVCGRPSANYTAALWDTETDKLYVIQYSS